MKMNKKNNDSEMNSLNKEVMSSSSNASNKLSQFRHMRWLKNRYACLAFVMAIVVLVTTVGALMVPASAWTTAEFANAPGVDASLVENGDAAPVAEPVEASAPAEAEVVATAPADQAAEAETDVIEPAEAPAASAPVEVPAEVPSVPAEVPAAPAADPGSQTPAEADPVNFPAQSFAGTAGDISVAVEADAGAFPAGTTMKVAPVNDQQSLDTIANAVEGNVSSVLAVDITFFDGNGQAVEPRIPIRVNMAVPEDEAVKAASQNAVKTAESEAVVVHLDDSGATQIVSHEDTTPEAVSAAGSVAVNPDDNAVAFEANSFSVYAVVYTVDFHYDVNGQELVYQLVGGSAIGFKELLPLIGIVENDPNTPADEVAEFVSDIAKAEFSNPTYCAVLKVDADTTVGALKEQYGLDVVYSADLEQETIEKIEAQPVKGADWVLMSLKPFDTEESLKITLTNGEVYVIKVTDAQDPFGLDGQQYEIVVNSSKALSPVSKTENIGGQNYYFLNDANTSSGSNLAWKLEYDHDAFDGEGGYYISHEGQYIKMVGDNSNDPNRTVTLVSDKAQATPIKITYDKAKGKYSFSNDADASKGFLGYFNNDYFGVDGSSSNDNTWMELRNPSNPSLPGFVSPWDVLGDNIKIKLFDYSGTVSGNNDIDDKWGTDYTANQWRNGTGVNKDRTFLFTGGGRNDSGDPYNYYTGSDPAVMQGIVKNHLENGYPVLTKVYKTGADDSLGYLFGAGGQDGVTPYEGAGGNGLKGLLRKDENGYYYFSSEQNFATLNAAKDEILLYSESYDKDKPSANSRKIGLFPFDPYRAGQSKAGEEKGPNGSPYNHQFGMTMEAKFVLPPDGKLPNGEDMVFNFSGDDDVWVFIDDVLVLDLGGVHQPLSGTINFAGEGYSKVTDASIQSVPGQTTVGSGKTLAELFEAAGEEYDDSPYSQHTIKFFYLERGGCDSNCTLSFNLLMYKTLTVAKELEGLTDEERAKYANDEFTCDIFVNGEPYNGSDTIRYDAAGNAIEQGFEVVDGKVHLKPGERVRIIGLKPTDTFYAAEENGLSMTEFYPPRAERFYQDEQKTSHEEEVALTEEHTAQDPDIADWRTKTYPVENLEELMFTNTLREKNLDIEKTWSDGASKHSNDEVKYKVKAKVVIDGKEYDYQDNITALYSDKTVKDRKISDILNQTYTLSEANDWKAQIEHLPGVNNAHQEIKYEVVEIQTANGYASNVTGTDSHNIDVVKIFPEDHTFADETIQFKFRKGQEGSYQYYNADSDSWGSEGAATVFTLNSENNYTWRFHDMPAADYSYLEVGSDNPNTDGLVVYDRQLRKSTIVNSPFNITVEKEWNPESLANENVDGRKVEVELGRYILMNKEGNLKIRKEGVPENATFRATYEVKNTDTGKVYGVYPYVRGGITIKVPEGNYTIKETILEDDETYSHTHGESVQTRKVENKDSGVPEVVFTAEYTPVMGQLIVKSTLNPNDTGVNYNNVVYEVFDKNGEKVKTVTFAQASAENGYSFETKLGEYTVKEVGVPATPQNVRARLKPKAPEGGSREIKALVKNAKTPGLAEFSATYTKVAVDTSATVHVSSTNGTPVDKTKGGFKVGDVIRISYNKNSGETINNPSVTGGTLVTQYPVEDQGPNGYNGYNGKYHVDIKITDQNVNVRFTNPGLNNGGWSAMSNDNVEITLVSSAKSLFSTASRLMSKALGDEEPLMTAAAPNYITIDLPEAGTTVQLPEAPAGKEYVEDTSFTHDKITLTYGHWSDIVKDLESVDENGNPYCYYIKSVHEEKMPATTTASIKMDGENLLLVGADNASTSLAVTNDVETKGPLALKKVVKVNGADPTDDNKAYTNGTYTFRVKASGDDTTLHIVTITYTDGEVTAATLDSANVEPDNDGYVHIDKIEQGDYVITEVAPVNGTSLSALDGGTATDLAASSVTVTVTAGEELAADAKACFTNNIETTQLAVNKVWTDASQVDHSNDTITYKLYRIAYTLDEHDEVIEHDRQEVAEAAGYDGQLTADTSWADTITNLPTTGSYTAGGGEAISVMYEYYVTEDIFPGYKPNPVGGWNSETKSYSFTFTNEPHSSFDKSTEVIVEKEWKNASGEDDQDAHDNDTITFCLVQTQYEAEIYPLKINLINGDGTTSDLSRTIYVPKDCQINLRPESQSNGNAHRVNVSGTNKDGTYLPRKTVYVNNANGGREVTFALQKNGDTWANEISGTEWTIVVYDNSHNGSVTQNDNIISEEDLMSWILEHGTPVETSHEPFEYTMQLNEAKNGTSVINGEHAIGEGTGDPDHKWKGKVTALPLYEKGEDGKFYGCTYAVTEVKIGSETVTATSESGFNGETSKYFVKWTGSDDSWTITNQKKPTIDITVKKINKNELTDPNAELLPGATFVLTKYKDATYQEVDDSWAAQTVVDTESRGAFSFTGLTEGYYMLDESVAPAGYVKTDKNPKFKVEDQKVILLNDDGEAVSGGNDGTVRVENSTDSTVFVGNEPGAALPSAGGMGTTLFTMIGGLMIALAGVWLLIRRRRLV